MSTSSPELSSPNIISFLEYGNHLLVYVPLLQTFDLNETHTKLKPRTLTFFLYVVGNCFELNVTRVLGRRPFLFSRYVVNPSVRMFLSGQHVYKKCPVNRVWTYGKRPLQVTIRTPRLIHVHIDVSRLKSIWAESRCDTWCGQNIVPTNTQPVFL